jgi:sec-independent protein translocase protein TatB
MFDLGFVEMLVIGLILLLVVGPERLPEVARAVGSWVHQAKQYFETMKDQLDRETQFSELQSQIKGEGGGTGSGAAGPAAGGQESGGPESGEGTADSGEAGSAAGATDGAAGEGAGAGPDVAGRSAAEGEAADSLERELSQDDPEQDGQGRG